MWQYLETVAGLCFWLCAEAPVCSMEKNLFWRSQECHTEEVKSIASPKWELDPREGRSYPLQWTLKLSELRLGSRFHGHFSAGSCAHRAHRGIFPSKTNWWLLPPSRQPLLSTAWYFKEPQETFPSELFLSYPPIQHLHGVTSVRERIWLDFGSLWQALWHPWRPVDSLVKLCPSQL